MEQVEYHIMFILICLFLRRSHLCKIHCMTNFEISVILLRRGVETVMLISKDKPTKFFKHELVRCNNKNKLFV
jgi:hypothetical protein